MILKQKAFQELAQIMKLKKNQEKNATSRYRTRILTKTRCAWSGTVQRQNLSHAGYSEARNGAQYKERH